MFVEATGRRLTLGGKVSLKFGLSPTLIITDVALANAPWASDPQMIKTRRIEDRIKLRVSGTMIDPTVRPDTLSILSKGARALSALAIGPLGLLAPFFNLGAFIAHPCSVHRIGK